MSRTDCPTLETLSAFALGELPEPELNAVAEHLDVCTECDEQASRLDGTADAMVAELRRLPDCWLGTDEPATEPVAVGDTASPPESFESWGEFRIIREIGRGGMGVVYEAYQGSLNRHVALKFLPESGDLARFRREARAAGRLHHTNIVPVFGVREQGGRHFYVMQYIAGHGLDVVLKGRASTAGSAARFDDREVARIGVRVAEALAYAHSHGVIHRDIKPSNLLLDDQGTAWVTDFGLAHDASDTFSLTRTGDFLGTLRYTAPERLSGRGDERVDIYGLGVTLYELVCGRPAHEEADRAALMRQILDHDPARPRAIDTGIARDLETIILKAMEREPAERYATAEALAEDLRRFLDDRTIRARRIGPWERAWRWARRNKAVAGLVAGIALALVLGAAVSTYFAIAANRNAARARLHSGRADEEARRAIDNAANAVAEARRADEEKRRANVEAKVAREVAQFLVGLFEDADPLAPWGRSFGAQKRTSDTLTAREIVDRGTKMLKTQLDDQPLVRATLLETLGSVYVGLGELDKAEPLIAEALGFRRRNLPAGRLELAACLHVLGCVRQIRYDPSCVDLLREALAIRRQLLGNRDRSTAETMFYLALALLQTELDRDGEAEKLLDASLAIRRKLNSKGPEVAYHLLVVGFLHAERAELSRAAPELLEGTLMLNRIEGGHDASAVLTLYARAIVTEKTVGVKRAIPFYSLVRDKAEALLGRDHYIVTYTNKIFAERLALAHEFARAEVFYRKAIDDCRRVRPDHKQIGPLMTWLGRCIKDGGDAARAERVLAEATTILERGPRTPGNLEHLSTCFRLRTVTFAMRAQREPSEAMPRKAWREMVALLDRAIALGTSPDELRTPSDEYYEVWKRAAISHLEIDDQDGFRRVCQTLRDQHPAVIDSRHVSEALASVLTLGPGGVGDDGKALGWIEHSLVSVDPADKVWKRRLLRALGAVLYRLGRYREAIDRLQEAIAVGEGKLTAEHAVFIALAHFRMGETEKARALLASPETDEPHPPGYDPWWGTHPRRLLHREAVRLILDCDMPANPFAP